MEEIYKLSKKYNFKILEDASHALGGSYNNYKVGSCKYSDITVFSFHPVKMITTGEGGLITTNNLSIFSSLKLLRSHGIVKDKRFFVNDNSTPWHYEQQILGYNFRMSDINAALGISQLERLDEIIRKRNKILENYKERLKNLPINFLKINPKVKSSVHLGIISLIDKSPDFHLHVFKEFHKRNIYIQIHYQPIHLNPYYLKMGFKKGSYPNSEIYATSSFSIPIYTKLEKSDFDYVIETFYSIFNEK